MVRNALEWLEYSTSCRYQTQRLRPRPTNDDPPWLRKHQTPPLVKEDRKACSPQQMQDTTNEVQQDRQQSEAECNPIEVARRQSAARVVQLRGEKMFSQLVSPGAAIPTLVPH